MVVTLNAILSLNGIVENKQFMVTVKAEDFTNEEYVEKSFNNLDIKGNLQGVVDNIKLCNEDDENKVSIIWNSRDRKSTRLNSSHANISYAVFCLKKKKKIN